MTPIGKLVFVLYSLIVLSALVYYSFKKIQDNEKGGWIAVTVIPIMILLVNLV